MHTADEVTELVNDWMRRRAADIMRFLDPEAEADDLAEEEAFEEEAFEEEAATMKNDRNSASAQDLTAEDVDADLPEPAGGAEGG
jgi:hypothetical protein